LLLGIVGYFVADARSSSRAFAVPIVGVWQVGDGLEFNTFYYISLDERTGLGTIAVERSGEILRTHTFEVSGPASIRIHGATRGQIDGEDISNGERSKILQLEMPPRELRFSRPEPDVAAENVDASLLFIDELCTQLQELVPLVRVGHGRSTSRGDQAREYETVIGEAQVTSGGIEYDGLSAQGFQLRRTAPTVRIKAKKTRYRAMLMPKLILASKYGSREVSRPLSVIRNSRRYKFYGFHRTLDEIHERYTGSGWIGNYFPARSFSNTKFFDVHKVKLLR
jgi:hypothetical protein